ncbi:hypothetical protein ACWENQ_45660 [Nonomuraea sp. NPDC004354]
MSEAWVGVNPHVPAHQRLHHAVPAKGADRLAAWHTSSCGLQVALLVERHNQPLYSAAGVEPLPFDTSLSVCCHDCLAVVAGTTPAVTELRPPQAG